MGQMMVMKCRQRDPPPFPIPEFEGALDFRLASSSNPLVRFRSMLRLNRPPISLYFVKSSVLSGRLKCATGVQNDGNNQRFQRDRSPANTIQFLLKAPSRNAFWICLR